MLGQVVPENSRAGRFAAVIPVGPAPAERLRLFDLLASLWHYEPNLSRVVVVDDGALVDFPAGPCPIDRVSNPRQGRGNGILGGLCTGILAGIKQCVSFASGIDFIVKIDTDALVIAPFAAQLARLFHDRPGAGMAGAYRFTPNGDRRDFSPWRELASDLGSKWIKDRARQRRAGRRSRHALFGAPAAMRRASQLALRNGYEPGENLQGGAYAVSIEAIRKMNAAGLLDNPLVWRDTSLGEDVLLPMLTRAVGMTLLDHCSDGEVFGVRYKGLPNPPEQLITRGFSIIHSVKNDANFTEGQIREFFATRRELPRSSRPINKVV